VTTYFIVIYRVLKRLAIQTQENLSKGLVCVLLELTKLTVIYFKDG